MRFALTQNNDNSDNSSSSLPGALPTSSLILSAAWRGKYYLCFADTFYLYPHHAPGRFIEDLLKIHKIQHHNER